MEIDNQEYMIEQRPYLKFVIEFYAQSEDFNSLFPKIDNNYQNIYFDNICLEVQPDTTEDCRKVYRGVLINGIKTSREEAKGLVRGYLGIIPLQEIPLRDFYQFKKALDIDELGVLNILEVWLSTTKNFLTILFITNIVLSVLLVVKRIYLFI